jgi:hypothetical protein
MTNCSKCKDTGSTMGMPHPDWCCCQAGKDQARIAELEAEVSRILSRWRETALSTYIERQQEWSARTFGPGARVLELLGHIRKELVEIEQAPRDLMEWVDVVILALDGAWRSGHSAEAIEAALREKQEINFARRWPAPGPEDSSNEHIRDKEETE